MTILITRHIYWFAAIIFIAGMFAWNLVWTAKFRNYQCKVYNGTNSLLDYSRAYGGIESYNEIQVLQNRLLSNESMEDWARRCFESDL